MVDGTLTIANLTYHYPGSENGIRGICFTLACDSLTTVTGRIGAGKSTLLRVMLSLLQRDSGEIIWNSHSINDLTAGFVPLQFVYIPLVPILCSEALRENILMGLEKEGIYLAIVLQAAVLEVDKMMAVGIEEM